jgi:hypothetical protein
MPNWIVVLAGLVAASVIFLGIVGLILLAYRNKRRRPAKPPPPGLPSNVLAAGPTTMADLPVGVSFDLKNPRAVRYLELHGAERVQQIDETTRGQLRTLLADGVSKGESYDTIAGRITATFDGFSRERATRIVVDECAVAYETGNMAVARDLQDGGLDMVKSLLTANDDQVDEDCRADAAAGWIPLDQAFPSGAMNAPIHSGCRCVTLTKRAGSL